MPEDFIPSIYEDNFYRIQFFGVALIRVIPIFLPHTKNDHNPFKIFGFQCLPIFFTIGKLNKLQGFVTF